MVNVPLSQRQGKQFEASKLTNWAEVRRQIRMGHLSPETHTLVPYSNHRYAIEILGGARFKYKNTNTWDLLHLEPKDKVRIQYKHATATGRGAKVTISARSLKFHVVEKTPVEAAKTWAKAQPAVTPDVLVYSGKTLEMSPENLRALAVLLEAKATLGL